MKCRVTIIMYVMSCIRMYGVARYGCVMVSVTWVTGRTAAPKSPLSPSASSPRIFTDAAC